MKKAIKKLSLFPPSVEIENLPLILSKYYVKQRNIMVIMETCSEDPTSYELVLSFLKTSVRLYLILFWARYSRN